MFEREGSTDMCLYLLRPSFSPASNTWVTFVILKVSGNTPSSNEILKTQCNES